jgi:hypothetical protein
MRNERVTPMSRRLAKAATELPGSTRTTRFGRRRPAMIIRMIRFPFLASSFTEQFLSGYA